MEKIYTVLTYLHLATNEFVQKDHPVKTHQDYHKTIYYLEKVFKELSDDRNVKIEFSDSREGQFYLHNSDNNQLLYSLISDVVEGAQRTKKELYMLFTSKSSSKKFSIEVVLNSLGGCDVVIMLNKREGFDDYDDAVICHLYMKSILKSILEGDKNYYHMSSGKSGISYKK